MLLRMPVPDCPLSVVTLEDGSSSVHARFKYLQYIARIFVQALNIAFTPDLVILLRTS